MRGLITSREVVLHAFTIIQLWGMATYVRCLRAAFSRRPTTFLTVVCAHRRRGVTETLQLAGRTTWTPDARSSPDPSMATYPNDPPTTRTRTTASTVDEAYG
jgi:hypothetical protein